MTAITHSLTPFENIPLWGSNTFVSDADNLWTEQMPRWTSEIGDVTSDINDVLTWFNDQATALNTHFMAINGYLGRYVDLTGAIAPPATSSHIGSVWVLNVPLAEASDVEPGTDPTVWTNITDLNGGLVEIDLDTIYLSVDSLATALDFFGGAAGKVLTADVIEAAYGYITLTPGATILVDMAAGINFRLTTSATCEISTPTGAVEGKSGIIVIDLTGAHDVTFATGWTMGEGVDLAGTSGTRHVLSYVVLPGSSVLVNQIGSAV